MATIYLNNGKAPVTQDGRIILGDCCCDKSACCDVECRLWINAISQTTNFGSDTRGYHTISAEIPSVGAAGISAAGCAGLYAESNTQVYSQEGEQNYGISHLGTDCAACTGSTACGRGHALVMGRQSAATEICGGASHAWREWDGRTTAYADARVRLVYAAPAWIAAGATLAAMKYTNNRWFTTPALTYIYFRAGVRIGSLPAGASGVRAVGTHHGSDTNGFSRWFDYTVAKTATGYSLVDNLTGSTTSWTSSDSTVGVYWGDGTSLSSNSSSIIQRRWASGSARYDPVCLMEVSIV